jgi:glycosyltransferase involved in cell wall biosynthesis
MPPERSKPFFTIIIATYNRASLITRALMSLAAQRENDWEALVIDDGSTDDTYSCIMPYLEGTYNIRYLKQQHKGMAAAKNSGIHTSTGRYITFLDSDDEYHPLHLETRKAILEENRRICFLHGKVKVIGNPYVPDRFDRNKLVNLNHCVIGGNFFIEHDTVLMLHGFRNIPIGSDADLFDRARNAGIRMMEVFLPTYIYHHDTADSLTNRSPIHSD